MANTHKFRLGRNVYEVSCYNKAFRLYFQWEPEGFWGLREEAKQLLSREDGLNKLLADLHARLVHTN